MPYYFYIILISYNIMKELLIESVSINDVNDAIDNHKRVIINYHTKGENIATGSRVIEVYAYGLTKAGNPVIRAFQPFGDTTSKIPSWKFFRLDRISSWKETEQTFSRPASFYYKNIGNFNENGDETMSVVYKIANFNSNVKNIQNNGPKLKDNDDVYKTDTEHRMERFKQQVTNPITLNDLKTQLIKNNNKTNDSGPKLKDKGEEVYKTDTERNMDNLRKQLDNPRKIDLSKFSKNKEPITFKDFNKNLQNDLKDKGEEVYKTDTERNMDNLRKQLDNPRKIDLSKFSKK